MSGATEAASKGNTVWKVALSILDLLRRPPFEMSADLAEGMIKGTCKHKALLAKQFTNN